MVYELGFLLLKSIALRLWFYHRDSGGVAV